MLLDSFSQLLFLTALAALRVSAISRPFAIEPPAHSTPVSDEMADLTLDQIIRRVMESHSSTAAMDSPKTTAMLMDGDSSMRLAEMDMMLTKEQFENLYGSPPLPADDSRPLIKRKRHARQKRKAYRNAQPWTDNIVPYVLNPWDFSGNERAVIHLAMQEWEQYTCLKFRPSNSTDINKLVFQNGLGCNSQLGQVGGSQALNLEAPGCRFKGLYLHEIGHALGLVHEHQLPNRDNYIDIIWQNVKPEWRQWFNKYSASEVVEDNIPYDLTSVMHYGITAFSYDDKSQTIQAKDRSLDHSIGRVYKKELSFSDIKAVDKLYQCSAHCSSRIRCTGGGYVGKDCTCVCPSGDNSCQTYPTVRPKPEVTCQNVHSSDASCEKWADEDQCSLNPIWMIKNCRKSCGKCNRVTKPELPLKTCSNRFDSVDCDTYARAGECNANPAWMLYNCKASCGWCNVSSACTDLYSDSNQCQQWKSFGYCDRNPAWMWANCRNTCEICTNPPQGCENLAGDDKCYADASVGECKENPDYMNINCAKACGKCGTCYNEYPEDSVCIDLAAAGECTLSPEWMGRYCKKACDACDGNELPIGEARPCKDKDSRCGQWAGEGECSANPSWMIPNCQKSCNKCDCENVHDNVKCDEWARRGECESNTPWMSQNCQKSCRFCTNLPPPSDRCSNKYTGDVSKCDQWQSEGECFKNPLFMLPQCRKACTQCGTDQVCRQWSAWSSWTGCSRSCGTGMRSRTRRCLSGTSRTEDEMAGCILEDCVTTLPTTTESRPTEGGVTTTPTTTTTGTTTVSSCKNKHQRGMDCDVWAKHGHCESNPSWMHTNCAKSCNLCVTFEICLNKYGDDDQCNEWAADDQCTANPSWMLANCAKACDQCDQKPPVVTTVTPTTSCINLYHSNSDCEAWANSGHCERNPGFMHINCAKSCGTCELLITTTSPATTTQATTVAPPTDCVDRHESCESWASNARNYCSTSNYVQLHCKTSCGLCTTPLHKEGGVFITDDCYDRSMSCKSKANEGWCISHSEQMKELCPYSCEYCQPSLCADADASCERWAAAQACHIFPKLMAQKCKLSCAYCSSNKPTRIMQP